MLEFIVYNKLTDEYMNQVWELLKKIDKEFIPPLSTRQSTHQKELNTPNTQSEEPVEYFRQMKEQKIILALEKDKVGGFLTYIFLYHQSSCICIIKIPSMAESWQKTFSLIIL